MKSLKLAFILAAAFQASTSQAVDSEKHHHIDEKHHHPVTVIVSTKRIVDESLRGKDIQKKLNDEQAALAAAFPAMSAAIQAKDALLGQQQNNYNDKVKSLEAKSKMLSEDARNKELNELRDLRHQIEDTKSEFERLKVKFNEDAAIAEQRLKGLYEKEMKAFEAEINDVMDKAKVQHGWDFVYPREGLLTASDRFDRSSVVIDMLDEIELKRRQAKLAEKKPAPAVKKAA